MTTACYWCNKDGATKNRESSRAYCSPECRIEVQRANNSLRGAAVIPPAEKEKREALLNGARGGDEKCQKVLSETPYFMHGVYDPKTQTMRRW
jgi:endogenous inhibitor of DNA gyrase (YacG/DUF329 family)